MFELMRVACLIILLVVSCTGCQLQKTSQPSPVITTGELPDQDQMNDFFIQGMQYANLNKQQQQTECQQLKLEYQTKPDWRTAWFLTHSLNDEFSCLSLKETIDFLQSIDASNEMYAPLQWPNKRQIKLLVLLLEYQKKAKSLRWQLKGTQKRLKEANSKIQALKAIEASINKKLDDQQTRK